VINYFKIDGRSYDVIVTAIEESFNILYSENTGRTMSQGAKMTLDPIGTFFGHKVTVRRKQGHEAEFDALYDYVSIPRYSGMDVEIVHNQTTLKYEAYVSSGARTLQQITKSDVVKWGELELNIIPMEAQVLPE
jgi:hypothetical protein